MRPALSEAHIHLNLPSPRVARTPRPGGIRTITTGGRGVPLYTMELSSFPLSPVTFPYIPSPGPIA